MVPNISHHQLMCSRMLHLLTTTTHTCIVNAIKQEKNTTTKDKHMQGPREQSMVTLTATSLDAPRILARWTCTTINHIIEMLASNHHRRFKSLLQQEALCNCFVGTLQNDRECKTTHDPIPTYIPTWTTKKIAFSRDHHKFSGKRNPDRSLLQHVSYHCYCTTLQVAKCLPFQKSDCTAWNKSSREKEQICCVPGQ